MAAILVVLIIFNVILASALVKKWIDNAPSAEPRPKQLRGREKPINEFFANNEPAATDVEVREIAEQLLDRIDRKIDVLKELIRQADSRIATMGGATREMPATNRSRDDASDLDAGRRGAARRGSSSRDDSQSGGVDKRSRIVQLHRKGFSSTQIAQEVQMGRGEVDLILNIESFDR
jgi:hypothetical protein